MKKLHSSYMLRMIKIENQDLLDKGLKILGLYVNYTKLSEIKNVNEVLFFLDYDGSIVCPGCVELHMEYPLELHLELKNRIVGMYGMKDVFHLNTQSVHDYLAKVL